MVHYPRFNSPPYAILTPSNPQTTHIEMDAILARLDSSSLASDILGLPQFASDDEINSRFKKLALICHPDKSFHPRAEEAFKRISKARSDILWGGLAEKLRVERDICSGLAEQLQLERDRYSAMLRKFKNDRERKLSFLESNGHCSDDQWRDDTASGWPVLPPKSQNPARHQKRKTAAVQ